ncbi:hypothetical protein [Nonomuraea sp. NPDC050540]|uniref:hypothetical protein n=1 Tax=Nonomuraea sp. NPDC050540 TaxID=3364367 RepID=UPI00379A3615
MGAHFVSALWGDKELRGRAATLERLRVDRQLEEALAHGADPLHLASVFGLDPETAIHYAENAECFWRPLLRSKIPPVPANPRVSTVHEA